MPNPVVEMFKTQIGKDSSKSISPVGKWLNGTILEIEEGKIKVEFEVRKEMTNPMGILHGGMSALIMDEIIGATVFTLNKEHFYTSVNLSVDFLSAVKLGEKVIAQAEVIRAGNTIVNVECRIYDTEGKVVAKGMSNLVRTFKAVK